MAEKEKRKAPNLSNYTDSGLVDSLGQIKMELDELKFQEGFFKEAIKGRRNGRTELKGERYQAKINFVTKRLPDMDKIKEFLIQHGEAYDDFCKDSSYAEVRVTKI